MRRSPPPRLYTAHVDGTVQQGSYEEAIVAVVDHSAPVRDRFLTLDGRRIHFLH